MLAKAERCSRWWRLAGVAFLAAVLSCGTGPEERAAEHRTRGETYLASGKRREATVEFQAALQAWPLDADAAQRMVPVSGRVASSISARMRVS